MHVSILKWDQDQRKIWTMEKNTKLHRKKNERKKLMALIEKCRIRSEQFRENENPL